MEIKKINISSIYLQESMLHRNIDEVEISLPFLELVYSISKIGLIHPITVREDKDGKYELHVGSRRLLAYKNLEIIYRHEPIKEYQTILATVYPPETKTEDMLVKNIHENKFRSDQDTVENIEAKISAVPFFLKCGREGELKENKILGYKILKLYMSFLRGNFKTNEKYLDEIKKITNCRDPLKGLDKFFEGIKENPRTFFDKVSIIFTAPTPIIFLMQEKTISLRSAKSLSAMKSEEDKIKLIKRLKDKENIPYKELHKIIKESNMKNSPLKNKKELLNYSKNIFLLLENKKIDLEDKEHEKIKAYLAEIEETLLGKR